MDSTIKIDSIVSMSNKVEYKKEQEVEEFRPLHTQWLQRGLNQFIPFDNSKTIKVVPSGYYSIHTSKEWGYYLNKEKVNLDEILELPMPEIKKVLKDIKTFWARKEYFNKYKYTHKRGILLYGVPGGGKSCLTQILIKYMIEQLDAVVFFLKDRDDVSRYIEFVSSILKTIEPNRPIITILEDIDGLCEISSVETMILNMLDGAEQMENIVYVATTNYPEKLKERILNRPSRFDRRYEIKLPNPKVRKFYFEKKLTPDDLLAINMDEWITKSEGFTIAHLKEMIVSTMIMGNDLDETVTYLKNLQSWDNIKSNKNSIGFGSGKKYDECDEDSEYVENDLTIDEAIELQKKRLGV